MNWTVRVFKTFAKDLADLPPDIRTAIERFISQTLPAADNPFALSRVEKLKGFKEYYKARFGEYRVGLRIIKESRTIELRRAGHRRDFYRHFP